MYIVLKPPSSQQNLIHETASICTCTCTYTMIYTYILNIVLDRTLCMYMYMNLSLTNLHCLLDERTHLE